MMAAKGGIPAGLLASCSLALTACSSPDKAVWLKENTPEMAAAEKQARETLPRFWARIDSADPAIEEKMVKVAYPTRHGGTEFLWMKVDAHGEGTVRGRLINEPEDVEGVHEGQVVNIEMSRIDDWTYRKAGKYFGQFTTRVLIKGADEKTAWEQGADLLAPTPLEPDA